MTQSLSLTLAQYAASTSAEAIPIDVREHAKQVILDEMASACFGASQPAGRLAARYAASFGGPAESRILGTPLRVSALRRRLLRQVADNQIMPSLLQIGRHSPAHLTESDKPNLHVTHPPRCSARRPSGVERANVRRRTPAVTPRHRATPSLDPLGVVGHARSLIRIIRSPRAPRRAAPPELPAR